MLTLLASLALAAPHSDAEQSLQTHLHKAQAVDQIWGAPRSRLDLVRRWQLDDPANASLAAWNAPERVAALGNWKLPTVSLRLTTRAAIGDLRPLSNQGDTEPGVFSMRQEVDGAVYLGLLEARVKGQAGFDVSPVSGLIRPLEYRVGVRTGGFRFGFAKEARFYGPGQHGSLMLGEHASPAPGVDIGGNWRFPGKADVLGRFSLETTVGWLPDSDRRRVQRPAWLVVDARWQPVPWIELGFTRTSMFGGNENGETRPVNIWQVILPTKPHVDDDPERDEHDSDERAAWDVRLTVPLHKLWPVIPIDYVEFTLQHGGEDIVVRHIGSLPVPSLAGSANVYGAGLGVRSWAFAGEWTVIEDDLYRWYTGHRLYYDGWTRSGQSMGHPWLGDQRSWWLQAGYVTDTLSVQLEWEHVRRTQVADVVQDSVFTMLEREIRDRAGVRGAYVHPRWGFFEAEVHGGPVRNADFVPGLDRFEWRVGLSWRMQALYFKHP